MKDSTPIAVPDGTWAIWSARVQLPIRMGSSHEDLLPEVSRALGSLDKAHAAFADALTDAGRWDRMIAALPDDDARALKRKVGPSAAHASLVAPRPLASGISAPYRADPAMPAGPAPQGAPRRAEVTQDTVQRWEEKHAAAPARSRQEINAEVLQLAAQGKSSTQIAAVVGLHSVTVARIAKAAGIKLKSPTPPAAALVAPQWLAAYKAGKTPDEIADGTPYSAKRVRRALIALGVKFKRAAPAVKPVPPIRRAKNPDWKTRAIKLAPTHTAAEIAVKVGQTAHQVRKTLRSLGIAPRPHFSVTPAEVDEIKALYATMGLEAVGKRVKRAHAVVRKILEDAGVTIRPRGENPRLPRGSEHVRYDLRARMVADLLREHAVEVAARYSDGESMETLGKAYGVGHTTIRAALVEIGVPIRSRPPRDLK